LLNFEFCTYIIISLILIYCRTLYIKHVEKIIFAFGIGLIPWTCLGITKFNPLPKLVEWAIIFFFPSKINFMQCKGLLSTPLVFHKCSPLSFPLGIKLVKPIIRATPYLTLIHTLLTLENVYMELDSIFELS